MKVQSKSASPPPPSPPLCVSICISALSRTIDFHWTFLSLSLSLFCTSRPPLRKWTTSKRGTWLTKLSNGWDFCDLRNIALSRKFAGNHFLSSNRALWSPEIKDCGTVRGERKGSNFACAYTPVRRRKVYSQKAGITWLLSNKFTQLHLIWYVMVFNANIVTLTYVVFNAHSLFNF